MTFMDRVASIRRQVDLVGMFECLRMVSEDKWSGVCPMHGGDNRNGFAVSRRNGEWTWRCFTGNCGGGDAIDLVMSRERCAMREAVDILDGGSQLPVGASRGLSPADNPARPPSIYLVCDACRHEVLEVAQKTYGNGGSRPNWTSSVELEAATAHGWELSAGLDYAIGPVCMGAQ